MVFFLNNFHRSLFLVLFICLSPVSISFSLSLTDRHHWHLYRPKTWLPTNHLSTVIMLNERFNIHLVGSYAYSVKFKNLWFRNILDEYRMQNTWFKCKNILQNAERLAGMHYYFPFKKYIPFYTLPCETIITPLPRANPWRDRLMCILIYGKLFIDD